METDDAGKAVRQAVLREWVQEGVDDPETLDAATVDARARKVIDDAAASGDAAPPFGSPAESSRRQSKGSRRSAFDKP
jgi:hypothetical protein